MSDNLPLPHLPTLQGLPRTRPTMLTIFADQVLTWIERGRSRRVLSSLSDHMLADLGISRCTADRESRKPFWRP